MGLLRNLLATREFHTRTLLLGLRQGWPPCPSIGIGKTLWDSQNSGCELPEDKLWTQITDDPD